MAKALKAIIAILQSPVKHQKRRMTITIIVTMKPSVPPPPTTTILLQTMRLENQITNSTGVAPVENAENRVPVVMLSADSLVAHPGNRLILDGSLGSQPDGDKITYRWSQ